MDASIVVRCLVPELILSIAKTPPPPYYAVIFTSLRTADENGYDGMAEEMMTAAARQPDFLGMESAREVLGITVSYWDSLESIAAWKRDTAHRAAQKLGRERWHQSYKTRICRVERDYDFD
ncbi:MAG: antibiotic biosynthesis monooxygenase [Pararobbsia sp.]